MPRSGVHIAAVDEREGIRYYTVRDLRNNMLVRNVTVKSARDLWHYAIVQYNTTAYRTDNLDWRVGADGISRFILNKAHRAGKMRYDIALRSRDGTAYIFYGVAEDGMDAVWRGLVAEHAQSAAGAPGSAMPAPGEAQPAAAMSSAEWSADATTGGADS